MRKGLDSSRRKGERGRKEEEEGMEKQRGRGWREQSPPSEIGN